MATEGLGRTNYLELICGVAKLTWPTPVASPDTMIFDSSSTAVKAKRVRPFPALLRFALLPVALLTLALSTPAGARATRSQVEGFLPANPGPAGLLAASPSDAKAPISGQFEGSLDKVVVESVGGWAWDGSTPNTPIKVEIYDGTRLLATVIAQEFREDLKGAGKGDGKHAFNYALPQTLRDGQAHAISVRYAGTASELPGSPKTVVFPKS